MSAPNLERESAEQSPEDYTTLRDSLAITKLRLEIRHLSNPWWRIPSNLGSIATIVGALLALVWAMATGFFDVSRRELDVRRRELQHEIQTLEERRDAQSRSFQAETRRQNSRISTLAREVDVQRSQRTSLEHEVQQLHIQRRLETERLAAFAHEAAGQRARRAALEIEIRRLDDQRRDELRRLQNEKAEQERLVAASTREIAVQRNAILFLDMERQQLTDAVKRLDQPIVVDVQRIKETDSDVTLVVAGHNLGPEAGAIHMVVTSEILYCQFGDVTPSGCWPLTLTDKISMKVVKWSPDTIITTARRNAVVEAVARLRGTSSEFVDPKQRPYSLEVAVERSDKRSSNHVELAWLQHWIPPP